MIKYQKVETNPNFVKIEKEITQFWTQNQIFEQSIRGEESFTFYDGPPFANGLPHYGHLLTGFIKDTFCRYQTMLGKKVERNFGWDCHGLPAEMAAEKELGISGKVEIENYGIEQFNSYCEKSVLKYTKEWKEYVTRQGRWVSFERDYKTMDISYMESVLWVFKTLYDKGLIYESMRIMPYSWKCETPVSDFETQMDNSYREKVSKSVTLGFRLKAVPHFISTKKIDCKEVQILVWTTTAWTLPSNLALAIGKQIKYSIIAKDDICFVVASELVDSFVNEIGKDIVCEIYGEELIGLSYLPPFSYFIQDKDYIGKNVNAFSILHGEFVTTESGTGIVHVAPGFGEEDFNLCKENSIEALCPVDNEGKFVSPIEDFIGQQVFDTNDEIIKILKKNKLLIKKEQYVHKYPHCWRTDTPLIYKAVSSWYLKVTDIKDKMIANNQKINWIPHHIKDGLFGKWLENIRDWSLSRNRYWGCPIPIWKSDDSRYPHIEVYGSIQEIEEAFNTKIKDLHKHSLDLLERPNPKDPSGVSKMRRVGEVLDCWFESGAMPYAQIHYPFENKEKFHQQFPADFTVEYLAQTRGWFYTMLVLSTALFNEAPFLNCICHGVILGDDKQKLSKRLKNYTDPNIVLREQSVDAMRWFMLSSPVIHGQEIVIKKDSKQIIEATRKIVKPLWSAYNFFILYAEIDQIAPSFSLKAEDLLNRYILAKVIQRCGVIGEALNHYNTVNATNAFEDLIEVLNNWYIRRSREKFWQEKKLDENENVEKFEAYNTLYTVLNLITRMIAPLLPHIAEKIYQGIFHSEAKRQIQSVHLDSFPNYYIEEDDEKLIYNMDRVRDACNIALHIRNKNKIKIRQPLSKVIFIGVADITASTNTKTKGAIEDQVAQETKEEKEVINHISNTNNAKAVTTTSNNFDNTSEKFKQLILDEINVKTWTNLPEEEITKFAQYGVELNIAQIAKRLPHKVQRIIRDSKNNDWSLGFENKELHITDEILLADSNEYRVTLKIKEEFRNVSASLSTNDGIVMLDTHLTPELYSEGRARDFIRAIQQFRKERDFHILDRIKLIITISTDITQDISCTNENNEKMRQILSSLAEYKNFICDQTLCDDFECFIESTFDPQSFDKKQELQSEELEIEGVVLRVYISKV